MNGTVFAVAKLSPLLAVANAQSAFAEDVPFNAAVSTSCSLVVDRHGTLVQNANARMLSTNTVAGGAQGLVTSTATSNSYRVLATPPSAFVTKPAADTSPTTFQQIMFGLGATTFSAVGPTPRKLNAGVTNLRITLIASKVAGQSFPNGFYKAVTIVTCE